MKQAFLNEPTLVEAREAYLGQHWNKPFTQSAWNGRKPSQKAFDRKFGVAYETRQRFLARRNGTVVAERAQDDFQGLFEAFAAYLGAVVEVEEELEEAESVGVEVVALSPSRANVAPKSENRPTVQRIVKPENAAREPSVDQMYFYIHRAIEAGKAFAIVPVRRDVAAQGIGSIKDDGLTYNQAIKALQAR